MQGKMVKPAIRLFYHYFGNLRWNMARDGTGVLKRHKIHGQRTEVYINEFKQGLATLPY